MCIFLLMFLYFFYIFVHECVYTSMCVCVYIYNGTIMEINYLWVNLC